jgi:hypothetical protein
MGVQAFRNLVARGELCGVAALIIIGVALIVLAPAKPGEGLGSRYVGLHSRKDADPDIPILKEAKAEYSKLQ